MSVLCPRLLARQLNPYVEGTESDEEEGGTPVASASEPGGPTDADDGDGEDIEDIKVYENPVIAEMKE